MSLVSTDILLGPEYVIQSSQDALPELKWLSILVASAEQDTTNYR